MALADELDKLAACKREMSEVHTAYDTQLYIVIARLAERLEEVNDTVWQLREDMAEALINKETLG